MGDRIVVMKDGEIQQADTPQTLYDHPCNLFVAGFIGSPQMNFVDAVIEKTADGYAASFAGNRIVLATKTDALAAYVGKTVVLGIRPEDLHIEGALFEKNQNSIVELRVEIAELMGAEIYAHCDCGGASMTVCAPGRLSIHSGDCIRAAIDMDKLHLFDKETEKAIEF